jgi:hypothetical protein
MRRQSTSYFVIEPSPNSSGDATLRKRSRLPPPCPETRFRSTSLTERRGTLEKFRAAPRHRTDCLIVTATQQIGAECAYSVRTHRPNRRHRSIYIGAIRLRVRQIRIIKRPRSKSTRVQCCLPLRTHTLTPARSIARTPIPRNDRLVRSVGLVIRLDLCRAVQFRVDPVGTFELCQYIVL